MFSLTINVQVTQAETGQSLLEVAQGMGIKIPTLCYHPGLRPYGSCRLCLVEMVKGPRVGLVASCSFPATEGMEVLTHSEHVMKVRRLVMEMTWAMAPDSEVLKEMAHEMGLQSLSLEPSEKKDGCVLCGRCVRACQLLGNSSISFIHKGSLREVSTPFQKASDDCMGCMACAYVCPTGSIEIEEQDEARFMANWETTLPLKRCLLCGRPLGPQRQWEKVRELTQPSIEALDCCPKCRRKASGLNILTGKKEVTSCKKE